jgi:hypothetical protein
MFEDSISQLKHAAIQVPGRNFRQLLPENRPPIAPPPGGAICLSSCLL